MSWQVFDIVGPIMIGPSSSHTSGAARLGKVVHELIGGTPETAEIQLHGSFAEVYKGHGTDIALLAGLLGFAPDDPRLRQAAEEAQQAGMTYMISCVDLGLGHHPNTAKFSVVRQGERLEVIGCSIGAGNVEIVSIEGIKTNYLDGKFETLIVMQQDAPGVVAEITETIAREGLNIAQMGVAREDRGERALTIINLDEKIPDDLITELACDERILWVKVLPIIY